MAAPTTASLLLLLIGILQSWCIFSSSDNSIFQDPSSKTSIYRTPAFTILPGEVSNKFYRMEFPKGHVGIRAFDAEVVDEVGNSVSLDEMYFHHWTAFNFHVKKTEKEAFLREGSSGPNNPSTRFVGNVSLCGEENGWGVGAENRRTNTTLPPPYAEEVGNLARIPDGFEELWEFNAHLIDTRGVVNPHGCTECRCDLFGVTNDEHGQLLPKDYIGGMKCCYDGARCKLKKGYEISNRTLYVQYKVRWVEWSEEVVPVRKYTLDVTNTGSECTVEYSIPACSMSGFPNECVDSREITAQIPEDGFLIYALAHQHWGARGSSLFSTNGEEICRSMPIYGVGSEAGNESGYVVGITACYPEPGSVKITSKDILKIQSNYSNLREHTGLMGIFTLVLASHPHTPSTVSSNIPEYLTYGQASDVVSNVLIVGVVITIVIICGIAYSKSKKSVGYQFLPK